MNNKNLITLFDTLEPLRGSIEVLNKYGMGVLNSLSEKGIIEGVDQDKMDIVMEMSVSEVLKTIIPDNDLRKEFMLLVKQMVDVLNIEKEDQHG
jgi:hypothetical protein